MCAYKNSTLKKYLDDLAARLPAPGGGSAAALNAAMGAGLLSMVIRFTLGKEKYARFQGKLSRLLESSEELRKELLNLVDLDVVAFCSDNARDCLDVPFMVARLSFEGIKICPGLIKMGNVNLISDIAVAAIFFESAFAAAACNVEINLKFIKNKRFNSGVRRELKAKGKRIKEIRRKTEQKIGAIIRG